MDSNFTLRNFYLGERRTSLKLDNESHAALLRICKKHDIHLNALMEMLEEERENSKVKMSRTAYLRVFIIHYLTNQAAIERKMPKDPEKTLAFLRKLTSSS